MLTEGKDGSLREAKAKTVVTILLAISFSHLLNDVIQALLPAIYPMLKQEFALDFGQIGLITLTFQMTASILQPVVGLGTDRCPLPYSLAAGMLLSFGGVVLLAFAGSFPMVLTAAALVGLGSSVFHPEASRVGRIASGGRHGLAQSVFQVGGNAGTALGPLLAAAIIVPRGRAHVVWFGLVALAGFIVLLQVGHWYRKRLACIAADRKESGAETETTGLSRGRVTGAIGVLLILIFSKFFYLASMVSYYTFFLIHRFHVSIQTSQVCLFVFLAATAGGTLIGGPIGDRIGRKLVIWISILGAAPFALALPHVSLPWVIALSVPIGVILASAFPSILVYAQELLPGRVGLIGGLFFGLAFGMGGIGSAVLGELADKTSIEHVFLICSFLPLIGLLTAFLPDLHVRKNFRR